MRRAAMIVFLALLTFNVSGLAAICGDTRCDEPCPTDLSGGQCPPNCHYCSCCSFPQMAGAQSVAMVAPAARATSWTASADDVTSPDPADILHVPKLLA